MANRNSPCPCGSGKKHKKCCLKDTVRPIFQPEIKGTFDPDLPIKPTDGGEGNYLDASGHWYVVRKGHGHKRTLPLEGERLHRAAAQITAYNEAKLKADKKKLGSFNAALAALVFE